ncbi:uncharacterized protein LOC127848228 isoform X1 [Dreissena polymorpha]|uniref:uncharacterized protein LOC127848228 isoform X1 n=1 Tax=Dreissena polymorpha TaxID=45954 RepID=UPI0022652D5F|nr:uncharacterized protein LOC127848228 isoform X1 [Dreissena polymorpha]
MRVVVNPDMKRSFTYHGGENMDVKLDLSTPRLAERTGIGSRSARVASWAENEQEAFQHHAEYLKRLSKLREELIMQEQNNLANALDRLRMRSYGREFVYSQSPREKKAVKQRLSAQPEHVQSKRTTLLTTFEKFQRMRPKRQPPAIMPLEGKSLIESGPSYERARPERRTVAAASAAAASAAADNDHHSQNTDFSSERSVDENVRLNLQRLTHQTAIPSIPPRRRRSTHRDLVLESNSVKRAYTSRDSNNSSEDRISQMQKQKQKLMKMRQEAREAEKLKLMPQSFRIDTLSDEDRMNLEKLQDYYCIYYIPETANSAREPDNQMHIHLPKISTGKTKNSIDSDNNSSPRSLHGKTVGFRIASDHPVPAHVCNCNCRMYVAGNRLDSANDMSFDAIRRTQEANGCTEPECNHQLPATQKKTQPPAPTSSRESSRGKGKRRKRSADRNENSSSFTVVDSNDRMHIHVNMPAIVFNTVNSPEPRSPDLGGGVPIPLTKAFKQKELRQRELCNLMEDVRELNKISESLTATPELSSYP